MNRIYIDRGDGYGVAPNPELDALRARQRRLAELHAEVRRLEREVRKAQRWASFWSHAALFYDNFFKSFTPSYSLTVAAMEHLGYITPSQRRQLIARTPSQKRAAASGFIAGILVSFWLPTKASNTTAPFRVGTRYHFWTPGAHFSALSRNLQPSRGFGLLNLYFRLPGGREIFRTITNGNVFSMFKFITGQMSGRLRKEIERRQDRGR